MEINPKVRNSRSTTLMCKTVSEKLLKHITVTSLAVSDTGCQTLFEVCSSDKSDLWKILLAARMISSSPMIKFMHTIKLLFSFFTLVMIPQRLKF